MRIMSLEPAIQPSFYFNVKNDIKVSALVSCQVGKVLVHVSPPRGPPGCIMQPAATFVNCVHTVKITK
jgi:hypothetical protein